MSSSSPADPDFHRQREREMMQHVERLAGDERLRIDTTRGARSASLMLRKEDGGDRKDDLHRLMSDLDVPDRELKERMPAGEWRAATYTRKKWLGLRTEVLGRLRVVSVTGASNDTWKSLLRGEAPKPLTPSDVQKALGALPPAVRGEPTTVVLVSTSGFTMEARELADRRSDRTVVLAEPNAAGGWRVIGPSSVKGLLDLLDPEADADKRRRVRQQIEASRLELLSGGLAGDRVAAKAQLPQQLVDAELKAYASENGLVTKRLGGRIVLFREGSSGAYGASQSSALGGLNMPLIDRMKALFGRKGETEKKISFLSERRAALSVQRDRAYEELGHLEGQENDLRQQFKDAAGTLTKKRVTSQLLQLRKDLERRQQLMGVLNQQINVVSTHLHNLELVQQGSTAKLPDADEMTADAVKAEEMLAELEATSELAATTGSVGVGGLTAEEQELFEELERESAPKADEPVATEPQREPKTGDKQRQRESPPPIPTTAEKHPRRSEPEAG
jgi:hypothetical protein